MTSIFQEAATQYGLSYPFDTNVLGDSYTDAYWYGNGRIGYPRTYVLTTSNGFKWYVEVVTHDDTHCTVNTMTLYRDNTVLWTAYGTGDTTYPSFDLSQIFGGDDMETGNSSGNFFVADTGNDTIDGGAGTDHVIYTMAAASANITRTNTGLVVSSSLGIDTLKNVERLDFGDESVAYDVNGTAGQAYRLYQAALNRSPDPGGLGYYIDKLEHGWSEHDIAIGFINSPEFQARYGPNISDLQYVELLYQNVLHRDGETDGIAFHLNELKIGLDRQQLLVNFSESPENQANLLGTMQQGMVYWPAG